jgi:alanine racemase
MAVVKSDAYGHGAASVAELMEAAGAEWLGVASIDEGAQIREAGVNLPILILSPTPSWGIATALENKLDITVTSPKQIIDVAQTASLGKLKLKETRARIHLKVDSGMHRLGVDAAAIDSILDLIAQHRQLELVSVFSHLARADDEDSVRAQNEIFAAVVTRARMKFPDAFYHLASSEATRRFPFAHYDMVRVGLYLYGLEPNTVSQDLHPALSVKARINHKSRIAKGQSVGYGWTWTADRDTDIASIPIGYADGIDRGLSNRMTGLLMGREIRQIGRISMDQMLFDVTDLPQAQEGDVITILGQDQRPGQSGADVAAASAQILLSSWAQTLDTITYELACRLRARLPRVYTRTRQRP